MSLAFLLVHVLYKTVSVILYSLWGKIHTHTHTHTYTYIHTYIHVIYIYTHTHTHMHMHTLYFSVALIPCGPPYGYILLSSLSVLQSCKGFYSYSLPFLM